MSSDISFFVWEGEVGWGIRIKTGMGKGFKAHLADYWDQSRQEAV